ncbi:hypothetical protein DV952_13520 [Staphylococcus pseudintermedius]|nr:hypothetical protein DV952_13520 [Staphylococcus pseudintermedius]
MLKKATKLKNIKIVDHDDGDAIACNITGIGPMFLNHQVVQITTKR